MVLELRSTCNSNEGTNKRTNLCGCADQRPAWAKLRIASNGLKHGQTALNCGQGGPEARNNQFLNHRLTLKLEDRYTVVKPDEVKMDR